MRHRNAVIATVIIASGTLWLSSCAKPAQFDVIMQQYKADYLSHDTDRLARWSLPPSDQILINLRKVTTAQTNLAAAMIGRWGMDFLKENNLQNSTMDPMVMVTDFQYTILRADDHSAELQTTATMLVGPPVQSKMFMQHREGRWYVVPQGGRGDFSEQDKRMFGELSALMQERAIAVAMLTERIHRGQIDKDATLKELTEGGNAYIQKVKAINATHTR